MKNLALIILLFYLASCNKGIKKPQDLSQYFQQQISEINTSGDTEAEYKLVRGYSCSAILPGVALPLFIEPVDENGESIFKFHHVLNNEEHKKILAQMNFSKIIDAEKDAELLKGLGFSKRQIRKIDRKNAETIEVATKIEFDENELTGRLVRKSVTKNSQGEIINRSSQVTGPLNDCQNSELEIEIEKK